MQRRLQPGETGIADRFEELDEPLSDQDYYGNADRCEDDSCEMCGVGPCNDEGCCRRGESGDDSE